MSDLLGLGKCSELGTRILKEASRWGYLIYEPKHLRRIAQAEADAMITRARGEEEALAIRAKNRIVAREMCRQRNIESILRKSVGARDSAEPLTDDRPDEDWIHQFFESCQDVSREEMQRLWAALLAGEVARPGSFSLRTLTLLKQMTPEEARMVAKLRSFVWKVSTYRPVYLGCRGLTTNEDSQGDEYRITRAIRNRLDEIGVIKTTIPPSAISFGENSESEVEYFGTRYRVRNRGPRISCAAIRLTSIGVELMEIVQAKPLETHRSCIVEMLRKKKLEVEEMK